ncbi:MAG: hypothetical protein CVT88_10665 [Candidatus Altiarchaeales archaeon HGW-Altiarchaeales-1]|nr:MAG: hypothetical protein CVT88_10665 [Candidatus Altiarchaeales archaeon HGW-Altiarchaeales-1]
MIHSSAPGKLMLFGEHSVIYGNPCIATSINKRLDVYLNDKNENGKELECTTIDALGINAKFPSNFEQHKFLNLTIAKFFEKYGQKNFELTTKPMPKGLGSSSAVVVAAVKALSALYNLTWSNDEIFKFSYEIVKEGQNGRASGYDIAVAVYGGTIRYENKNGDMKVKKLKNIRNLIAIDTGIKSSTTELVREISEKRNKYKEIFDGIFKIINKIKPYCYGAKISGAGRGDYIIAICKEESKNDLMDYLRDRKIEAFEILPAEGVDVKFIKNL